MTVKEITELLKNPSEEDTKLINRAFDFAQKAHTEQKRYSGEPYFIHPFETAKILASLQMDAQTIAASLLHDVCEDDGVSEKALHKEFGGEIAFLVNGVTKLGTLRYHGEKGRIENLRKMFLAMAKDARVILIKLADRMHNMRTLQYVPEEKQRRIAVETLEIYAPLANRLGMGEIKGQLEDLAFPFVYPDEYKHTKELMIHEYEAKKRDLVKIKYRLSEELKENGFQDIKMDARVKHLYSLFRKLQKYDTNINQIYDLIAPRVIVKTIEECYRVLGVIHEIWKPLPGRIKDYIAVPKPNGYRSLHTTVFADKGEIIEIQVRTEEMHEEAEYGIAAHWAYEEKDKPKDWKFNPRYAWVNQLARWQKEVRDSEDFLEALKIDFFKNRVFCFTPKGDVVDLPEGATALDFAYGVHTEIGNHAVGALINNKFLSLDTILKNGDIIEIKTQKSKWPSQGWLEIVKTSLAKKEIRSYLNLRERDL